MHERFADGPGYRRRAPHLWTLALHASRETPFDDIARRTAYRLVGDVTPESASLADTRPGQRWTPNGPPGFSTASIWRADGTAHPHRRARPRQPPRTVRSTVLALAVECPAQIVRLDPSRVQRRPKKPRMNRMMTMRPTIQMMRFTVFPFACA